MNDSRSSTPAAFDIIGDVHGCYDELVELLATLGNARHPSRPAPHIVFLGDLIDRGPNSVATVRLVLSLLDSGVASCILGNHEVGLLRWLRDAHQYPPPPWLTATLSEFEREDPELLQRFGARLLNLSPILSLVPNQLVAVHAAFPYADAPQHSQEAWNLAVFGAVAKPSTGQRRSRAWVDSYDGEAIVVYGHYPTPSVHVAGRTFGIDTGCVYGGALTALRYPELDVYSVPAHATYHPAPDSFGNQV